MNVSATWYKSTHAHLDVVVSCCSGGDGCDVEQTGQSVLCSCVDHCPSCSSWTAITIPAHISTVQGNKLINNPTYTFNTENNKLNKTLKEKFKWIIYAIYNMKSTF